MSAMNRIGLYALALLLLAALAAPLPVRAAAAGGGQPTYSDDEVVKAANDFFKNGAADLGKVLSKVLREKGQPVAYIRGEEAGGAIGVGLRYGHGDLVYKGGAGRKVYWQGPSIGFRAPVPALSGCRGQSLLHRRLWRELCAGRPDRDCAGALRRRLAPGHRHQLHALLAEKTHQSVLTLAGERQ